MVDKFKSATLINLENKEIKTINVMKNLLLIIILLTGSVYAQDINLHLDRVEPNYGLAVTGTGMTLCAIGTTMNQSPQQVYYPRYGSNYVRYEDQNSKNLRLSTMAIGAIVTVVGIIIQNKKRKNA